MINQINFHPVNTKKNSKAEWEIRLSTRINTPNCMNDLVRQKAPNYKRCKGEWTTKG